MNYTKNQMANINNPYQGKAKKVLCVCSAGLLRSPTAAYILNREFGYNTRAAGVGDYALIPVSYPLLAWADEIVVMEQPHKTFLKYLMNIEVVPNEDPSVTDKILDKVIVLNIPDNYAYGDHQLEELILTNYKFATSNSDPT